MNVPPDQKRPTASWLERFDQLIERASDWINPILVKETRQALKSQQFVLWFLLLLGGCWVVTIGGLAVIGPAAYYSSSGGQMFEWYAWMLAFPLLVVIPFSAFRSLAAEQEDNTRDVLTVSALTPRQVINGKLGSAALQMMIYLSAIAPCLGFTYLLRGIDAFTLFWLPALGVLACLGLSMVGLLLASITQTRYVQVLLSVAFVGGLLLVFWGAVEGISEFVDRGYSYYRSQEFWLLQGAWLTLYATTILLVYFAAIARNTFTSANRSTALRVAMLIQQAAFIGWATVFWQHGPDAEFTVYAYFFVLAYWTLAAMVMTGEGHVLSERVRRSLPSSMPGRLLFTWLTPGPGTGYFFAVANMTFCLLIASLGIAYGNNPRNMPLIISALSLITAYCVGYLGLGRLAILALKRFAKVTLPGAFLIHMLIQLAGYSLPVVVRSSSAQFPENSFSYFDLTSPIFMAAHLDRNVLTPGERITSLILVGAFSLSMLLANMALAAAEVRRTRSPLPKRILEDDLEIAGPATPKPTNPWGDLPRKKDELAPEVATDSGGV